VVPRPAKGSHDALLTRLDTTTDPGQITALLDDLVMLAENAARDGKPDAVGDIMIRVMKREALLQDFETKRAFQMAQRRMAKPIPLRAIATQLPHRPERRADYIEILSRAGEDGADALIEQMATVTHTADRRVYYDVLVRLKAGVPTLIHMLGDTRWFIARNAADLLGEMQTRDAEQPLTELLRHDDDRVRRAARGALMRLGTPRAMQSIEDALKDQVPQMRIEAAAALVTRKDAKAAGTLLRALELEKDEEVQAAYLHALGKIATQDAVQRLIRAAQGERGLFKKRATAFRLAAIHGLAEARTTEATNALKELKNDKEQEVRDAAAFALGRINRSTASMERPALPPE
jgi:HEAT repeat protein